ncbi:zinc finger protein 197 [Folsomia candida]|nr:zinc finger protein 197 [Folsomia candida]
MRRMHRFRPKKQFCCGLCQDSFDTVANLAIHKKKKHPDKVTQAELRSNCGICGKDLNVISMSIHMEVVHKTIPSISCSTCGMQFNEKHRKSDYLRHTARFREVPCKCSEPNCSETFKRVRDARLHAERHAALKIKDGKTLCSLCPGEFKSTRNYALHMRKGHPSFDCKLCGMRFKQRCHLEMHQKSHGNKRPYKCDRCGKRFKDVNYFELHKQDHVDRDHGAVFKCSTCSAILRNRRGFVDHIRRQLCRNAKPLPPRKTYDLSNLPKGIAQCYFCRKAVTGSVLEDHYRLHLLETPYRCWICPERVAFFSSVTLYRHLTRNSSLYRGHDPGLEKESRGEEIPCTQTNCGKTFATILQLNRHLDMTVGVTWEKCPLCPQLFSTQSQLKLHKDRDHFATTAPPRFSCTAYGCTESFHTLPALLDHKGVVHTGAKAACTICGIIMCKSGIKKHQEVTHWNLEKFRCNFCGKELSSRYNLESHVRVHLDEKAYKCVYCKATFHTGQYSVLHAKLCRAGYISEDGSEITCPFPSCGKIFGGLVSYLVHRNKKHAIRPGEECYFCGKFIQQEEMGVHLKEEHLREKMAK